MVTVMAVRRAAPAIAGGNAMMLLARGRAFALGLVALAACTSEPSLAALSIDAAIAPIDEPAPQDAATPSSPADAAPPPIHDASIAPVDAAAPLPSFPAASDFGAAGPFETVREAAGDTCTVYRPKTLGENGLRHPVIIWGNGTYTPSEAIYSGFTQHWASHGFIVAAAHTSNAGTGAEMIACLDWVEAEDGRAGSPYEGHVARGLAGATGHSQGGGGALMTGRDPRVRVTAPIMAYTEGLGHDPACQMQQQGPLLLISGGMDTVAPPTQNQAPVFAASNVPTCWATYKAGDHVSVALGGVMPYLAPITAWFRLHLMGDQSARAMFYGADCTLCTDDAWMMQCKGLD
jgi:hypothetical protein